MSTPTAVSAIVNSFEDVQVTMSDGSVVKCGSFTNAVANRNAPPQMLHDAGTVYIATFTAAMASATAAQSQAEQAATTAQNELAALRAQLNTVAANYIAATTPEAKQAAIDAFVPLTVQGAVAQAAAQVAQLQDQLTAAQAVHAAVAAQIPVTPTPAT